MTSSRTARLAGAAALTAATLGAGLGGGLAAAPAQAAGATVHGCPSGAVCIYPENAGWNGDKPSLIFYSYGAHNLSNQVGHHYILNNQYDYKPSGGGYIAAGVLGFSGYNATGTQEFQYINYIHRGAGGEAAYGNPDLTPVNSIDLYVAGP